VRVVSTTVMREAPSAAFGPAALAQCLAAAPVKPLLPDRLPGISGQARIEIPLNADQVAIAIEYHQGRG
jgi:hypothetical protein